MVPYPHGSSEHRHGRCRRVLTEREHSSAEPMPMCSVVRSAVCPHLITRSIAGENDMREDDWWNLYDWWHTETDDYAELAPEPNEDVDENVKDCED